jgi:16S rRNA processing protein RimM
VGSTFVVEPTVPGLPGVFTIESVRPHLGRLLVVFAEVPDRNAAELVRGVTLQVESSEMPPPEDPEEFHDHQLKGLQAVTPVGEVLGTVTRIEHGPGADLLVLKLVDGKPGLVPFVRAIVPEVDIPGGRVVIDPPPGLFTVND